MEARWERHWGSIKGTGRKAFAGPALSCSFWGPGQVTVLPCHNCGTGELPCQPGMGVWPWQCWLGEGHSAGCTGPGC